MTPTHFYLVTANPFVEGDPGHAEEGWFIVKRGSVILTDAAGVPLPGDDKRKIERDPLTTAKRLLRARWLRKPRSDFNRRLVYPRGGVA